MKTTIWKFPIATVDLQKVMMPRGAEILTVQTQVDTVCLWALVDPSAKSEERLIETFGTGQPIENQQEREYIATYQLEGGDLVFHVFEWLGL